MVAGARVYVEGILKLDEWTAQDGTKRHGLSVMSWHCRLSQIGRNKPRSRDDGNQKIAASQRRDPVRQSPPVEFDDGMPL